MTNIHESPELNRYMGYWTTLTKEVKWGNSCDCKHKDQFYAAGYCAEERKPGVVCSILPSKCQTQMLLTFGFFGVFGAITQLYHSTSIWAILVIRASWLQRTTAGIAKSVLVHSLSFIHSLLWLYFQTAPDLAPLCTTMSPVSRSQSQIWSAALNPGSLNCLLHQVITE